MILVTVAEAGASKLVDWEDLSTLKAMTCINHPTAEYLTKNPGIRSLHFIKPPVEAPVAGWPNGGFECPCPYSDLRVVIRDQEEANR